MQVIKLWSRQSDIDSPQFNERKFLNMFLKKAWMKWMNKCIKLIKIYKKLTKNLTLYMCINKKIKIYLAEFMKTAPAGNRLGHTV